ncbi:MAG: peptide chain release factor N(5)-glutamine methyltransferase [Chloroflexota bacterium]|nr:peptide chain release factor N(5)-glutamine methyltransferase [Chloroflexota bacterium]
MPGTKIGEALGVAAKRLISTSSTPRLDAEVLLSHVTGLGRAALLARVEQELSAGQAQAFSSLVERRTHGEPVAYLTGHKEFYGLDLLITRDVLVPRPETESVVDACLEHLPETGNCRMADIGTGSGAILVAVATRRPNCRCFGTEISAEAMAVASENCRRAGVDKRITLLLGDLLEPLPGKMDLLAANLPYVSMGEASPDVATWEPQVAVFGGGDDGTETIRRFLKSAPAYLLPGGTVIMETAYSQGKIVAGLSHDAFPGAEVEVRRDLSGYDRIVVIRIL